MNSIIILNSFKADIKFVARDPMLLVASLAPFFMILLLRIGFPLFSEFVFRKTGFQLDNYYALIAITIVCVIPLLFGMIYAFMLLDESDLHILQVISVTPAGKMNFLYMRMMVPAFLSFILVWLSIILTNPVNTEGWLRTIYISILLAIQSAFVLLFIVSLARNKVEGFALSKFYGIFLAAVPLGLILHHPWNYLAFFSPLYWISWAWISPSSWESAIYGVISMVISFGSIIIFFRHFLHKHLE